MEGKKLKIILVLVAAVILSLGWVFFFIERNRPVETITKIERRVDTIKIEKPVPVFHTIKSFALLEYPVDSLIYVAGDTVQVQVPIEEKIYQDSTYKCQVSGYKPSLDWIDIYAPTTTITTTNVVHYRPLVSFGVGATAG